MRLSDDVSSRPDHFKEISLIFEIEALQIEAYATVQHTRIEQKPADTTGSDGQKERERKVRSMKTSPTRARTPGYDMCVP